MTKGNALLALLLGGAISAGVPACSDHDQVRTSVVMCESATQHIKKCCGAAPPGVSCEYSYREAVLCFDGPCSPVEKEPDFSESAANCILARGCVAIAGINACSPGNSTDGTKAANRIGAALGCTP